MVFRSVVDSCDKDVINIQVLPFYFLVISLHFIKMLTTVACFGFRMSFRARNGRKRLRIWNWNFSNAIKLNLDCRSNLWWK